MNLHSLKENAQAFFSKELNTGIIWSVASLGVLAISGVIINFLIIIFRGEATLGIFNQVYALYVITSQIGVGGLQFSVLKRVSENSTDREKISEITGSALILVFVITTILAICGWYAAPALGNLLQSESVALGIRIVMPGLVFFCLNKVLINVVNGLEQMKQYAIFRSSRYAMIPLFLGGLLILELDSSFLVLALVLSEFILFLALVSFLYSKHLSVKLLAIPGQQFAQHMQYSSRGFLSGILVELNTRIDVLILGFFLDDHSVGVYSFVATIAEGFRQLSMAIRWNIDPQIGKALARNAKHEIETLSRSIRASYFVPILIAGISSVSAFPLVLKLLTGDFNWSSTMLLAVMVVGVLIGHWYRPFAGLLLQGGKPGIFSLYVFFLLLGDASLNFLVLPYLGILGAAIVTAITYSLEGFYLRILVKRLFSISL